MTRIVTLPLAACCAVGLVVGAGVTRPLAAAQTQPQGEIEVLHIRGNLYLLAGAGGTVVASVG